MTQRRLVYDIETDGLLDTVSKIHCIIMKDIDTGELFTFTDNFEEAVGLMSSADLLIAHNQIGYDLQVVKKFYPNFEIPPVDKLADTYILSKLAYPDRPWGHSLEKWANYLRSKGEVAPEKVQISDWKNLTIEEYVERCVVDVEINEAVFKFLSINFNAKKFDLIKAFECEQKIALIHQEQIQHGVCFNEHKARFFVYVLGERKLSLERDMLQYFKPAVKKPSANPTVPFTRAGKYTAVTSKWFGEDVDIVGGVFCKVAFDAVGDLLSRRQELASQLLRLGWKPISFTPTKVPKLIIDKEPCPSLKQFGTLGNNLSLYFTYSHRQNQIKGFLKHIWKDEKGVTRISSDADTIGTPTFRYTHRIVANIPKAAKSIVFGAQMRSLFTVPADYRMVGSDASGLELRMLAHYVNDKDYTHTITDGDIHSMHQEMAGLPTRDNAKSFIYAFLYGAGVTKLGEVIGGSRKAGTQLKDKFMKANPKLAGLIGGVQKSASDGFLEGLDGRRITMRVFNNEIQTHKALNTLLQSAGATVMKYADIWLYEKVKALGLDAHQVISYHDETQWEVHKDDVKQFISLGNQWVREAGEQLGMQCPLASDAQVGLNWRDTH